MIPKSSTTPQEIRQAILDSPCSWCGRRIGDHDVFRLPPTAHPMRDLGAAILDTPLGRAFDRLAVWTLDGLTNAVDAFTRWLQR